MLLLVILACLCIVCSPAKPSQLSLSAFCRSHQPTEGYEYVNHPISVPELHIPWVWEAVHDPVQGHVDVSVITPNACSFNQTQWKEFSVRFPQYEKYMGKGLTSNILVDSNCEGDRKIHLHTLLGILGRKVTCVYHRKGQVVGRDLSLRVRLKMPTFGPLVIRCPVPPKLQFDSMQLEIREGFSPFCTAEFGMSNTGYTNSTKVFPVCTLPHYDKHHKKYELSIVSATARVDEKKMVEWIEYHRLMGVQHFFLYNTAIVPSTITGINRILSPYVKEGLVTLVPWHFMNCVRGMGSGRLMFYYEPNKNYDPKNPATMRQRSSYDLHTFRPPHPIANYAALMSGYSRFRHTSTYILYVDDDEFVSLASNNTSRNIVQLAHDVFKQQPNASAIYLHPIDMYDCPDNDRRARRIKDTTLPRLGSLQYAFVGDYSNYEHKILMRTDSVVLFSVHYISLLELHFVNSSEPTFEVKYPLPQAALLHFKTPSYLSGDPFSYGNGLPFQVNVNQTYHCRNAQRVVDPYREGMLNNVNVTGHVLSARFLSQLIDNVTKRLKSHSNS